MDKRVKIIFVILILLAFLAISFYISSFNNNFNVTSVNSQIQSKNNLDWNKTHYSNVFSSTDVDIYKFYSKKPGPKYAFILGVHPYEWEAHQAFYDAISKFTSSPNFKGQIDIYWVKVPDEVGMKYDKGRDSGERTVGYFIFPKIKKENYTAIFDIHSALEGYPYAGGPKWYFFYTPTNSSRSWAYNLSKMMNWAPTLERPHYHTLDSYDYHGKVLYGLAKSGVPIVVVEWGWCKAESLWINEGKINLKATDPGEYEDKFKHALIFLDKIESLSQV